MAVSNRVGLACFFYVFFYAVFYFPTRYYRRNNTPQSIKLNIKCRPTFEKSGFLPSKAIEKNKKICYTDYAKQN